MLVRQLNLDTYATINPRTLEAFPFLLKPVLCFFFSLINVLWGKTAVHLIDLVVKGEKEPK